MKILLEAACGGHLVELSLLWPALKKHDLILLTNLVTEESRSWIKSRFAPRVYFIPNWFTNVTGNLFADYVKSFLIDSLLNFRFCLGLLRLEDPDFILSTGACTTIVLAILGRALGAKVIYVESPARLTWPSFTGRVLYWFSNLFLVQWETLLGQFGKRAKFWGSVL